MLKECDLEIVGKRVRLSSIDRAYLYVSGLSMCACTTYMIISKKQLKIDGSRPRSPRPKIGHYGESVNMGTRLLRQGQAEKHQRFPAVREASGIRPREKGRAEGRPRQHSPGTGDLPEKLDCTIGILT